MNIIKKYINLCEKYNISYTADIKPIKRYTLPNKKEEIK